jgi:CRP/FNR family nitrogen fixation transcriptional regulator
MLSPLRIDAAPMALESVLAIPGACPRFARDEEIFGEGEAATHVYQVISGAVRTYRILRDGRRQIDEFHFAGDYFGLEMSDTHRVTAEAMGDASVRMIRRGALSDLAATRGDAARALFRLTAEGLRRSQDHVLMLGRRSALERVVGLLLDIAERTHADAELDVPMSRQDMADYLGLTIETVSRTLTQLQGERVVEFASLRRFQVRQWPQLEALAA